MPILGTGFSTHASPRQCRAKGLKRQCLSQVKESRRTRVQSNRAVNAGGFIRHIHHSLHMGTDRIKSLCCCRPFADHQTRRVSKHVV